MVEWGSAAGGAAVLDCITAGGAVGVNWLQAEAVKVSWPQAEQQGLVNCRQGSKGLL